MQVNYKNNQQTPQFRMAFRRPNTDIIPNASDLVKKGLKQFELEQKGLKFFDTRYNLHDKSVDVIDIRTGLPTHTYKYTDSVTGLDIKGEINYPGKKLIAKLFNPKRFLPQNLYLAGEKAKDLDIIITKRERLNQTINL